MNIARKLMIAAAIPALAFAASAQTPAQKAPAQKPAPAALKAAAPAAKPAPAKKQLTNAEALAFLPEVLAEGNGMKLTKAAFLKELAGQVPEGALAQIPAPQLKQIVKNMVQSMVDREVLFSIAQKNGYKPSPALVEQEFDKMFAQIPADKRKEFEAQLKLQNKTIASYKKEVASDAMAQKAAAFAKFLKEKIEPQCKVSDADVEKFYREHQKEFQTQETVTASHILIRPEIPAGKEKDNAAVAKAEADALAKAKAVLAKLKQGADFGELAEKESACPSGKSSKGSLGKFQKGMMVPEFEKTAFALKKGEMSEIVKTQFGYHIIKVTDKTESSYRPLAEVKGNIHDFLMSKQLEEKVKAAVDQAKKDMKLKIAEF